MQGLKEITMHEVGHTLGLRHNFKASAYLSLDDIDNNAEKTAETGLTASVMDYTPVHIVPKGKKQGDYYSRTIGPYDMWAIEYGYKPASGGSPEGELKELKKIAARSAEPGLQFATDEDVRGTRSGVSIDSDPEVNHFDLGKNPLDYVQQRAELISSLWPTVIDRVVKDGEGYQKARQAFGVLLGNYGRAMHFAARYIGGVSVNRSHKGDEKAADPFVVTEPEKQRAALTLLGKTSVQRQAVRVPARPVQPPGCHPLGSLGRRRAAADRLPGARSDFDVAAKHSRSVAFALHAASVARQRIENSRGQGRFHHGRVDHAPDESDFLGTGNRSRGRIHQSQASHQQFPTQFAAGIPEPACRRLAMSESRVFVGNARRIDDWRAPSDCETIAYTELKSLKEQMGKLLASNAKLDDYTKSHLTESSARIGKILDSHVELIDP